jgi:hypothetical protein
MVPSRINDLRCYAHRFVGRQILLQHWPLPLHAAPEGRLHCPRLGGPQQTLGAVQVAQGLPPVPQAAFVLPGRQRLLWQQPTQLLGPHVVTFWQMPFTHCVPDGQQVPPHAVVPDGQTHWQLAFKTLGGVQTWTHWLLQSVVPAGHSH